MDNIIYTSLFSLMFVTHVFANDTILQCNEEGSNAEIIKCSNDAYKLADMKLKETWKILISKEKANKSYIKLLTEAQTVWKNFRDLEVKAMFACDQDMQPCWGSQYPMLYNRAMTEITEVRRKRLQQFIDEGQDSSIGERL